MMQEYEVEITFRRVKEVFTWNGPALDEQSAKFAALRFAQGCGYDEVVKGYKITAV